MKNTLRESDIRLHLKISLLSSEDEEFLGPGVLELLGRIASTGSIQRAARDMNLSYVKALKILKRMEAGLPHPVLIRHKGGHERGSSRLTPYGLRLLEKYTEFRNQTLQYALRHFMTFKKDVLNE